MRALEHFTGAAIDVEKAKAAALAALKKETGTETNQQSGENKNG